MAMTARMTKLVAVLAVAMLLIGFGPEIIRIGFSADFVGDIDMFTQKEPFSGKGSNMSSDAFGPQDVVILYALVTCNEAPMESLTVAFDVKPPNNETFTLTAVTNSSGIAVANFTVPTPIGDEKEVFGMWSVLGSVEINEKFFYDSLTFKADYIVRLLSVRAIDENLTERIYFGINGDVGLEISLRSIAMTMENTTLAVTILDELGFPIGSWIIEDFDVLPNERIIFLYCKLRIPKHSVVGNATVYVSALTALVSKGGVAYCPGISTKFYILPANPITVTLHDVGVIDVAPSTLRVELGDLFSINVLVRNEGTEIEAFNVTIYCGDVLVGAKKVSNLLPYSKSTLNFNVDTSSLGAGNYTIRVFIPELTKEADLTDNEFLDGVVEVYVEQPPIHHDVAVLNVLPNSSFVYVGETVEIAVTVKNLGDVSESFTVTSYYDSLVIGNLLVENLEPSTEKTLLFYWTTIGLSEGNYTLSARASVVSGEENLDNNFFEDGIVEVETKPPVPIHDIAIISVVPSTSLVYIGDVLDVNITVKNKGDETETFNLTLYYNSSIIDTVLVENLMPSSELTLVFQWNTSDVSSGKYVLSASAPLAGDINPSDNAFVDGVIEVKTKQPPIPTHSLDILSSPISQVSFTINGTTKETPYSAILNEGAYMIIFPHDWTDIATGTQYSFIHWSDGVTNPTRIVSLTSNMTLIAYYEKAEYTLTIVSNTGGTTNPHPGIHSYPRGALVIVSALPDGSHLFDYWTLDGVTRTENPIHVVMDKNYTLTAYFKAISKYTLYVTSTPMLGVNFTMNEKTQTTPYSATLQGGRYTIIMPLSITDSSTGKKYEFTGWEDGSTDSARAITLDRNMNLTAYYKEAVGGWFVPEWFYLLFPWLLLLLIIIIIILLYRRRRKKKAQTAFNGGWTAWYYHYSLLNKEHRTAWHSAYSNRNTIVR